MPELNVKTVASDKVWSSPDGQRVIYKVGLEYEGKNFEAKTYSKDISQVGWEGAVISEERAGKFGSETFVKQPQKEGGFTPGGGGSGRTFTPKDEKAIQAQMAIKAAVQAAGVKPEKMLVAEYTGVVYDIAVQLFDMIDTVKSSGDDATPEATDSGDPVIEEMKQALGDAELTNEEDPWSKEKALLGQTQLPTS